MQNDVKKTITYGYLKRQFKNYEVTEEKLCRGRKEMNHMGNSYLCYLTSNRAYKKLHGEYHSKGERTIQETASLVGLTLPNSHDRVE
ncbi:Srrd (predicted) [Pycnogonum litorale]